MALLSEEEGGDVHSSASAEAQTGSEQPSSSSDQMTGGRDPRRGSGKAAQEDASHAHDSDDDSSGHKQHEDGSGNRGRGSSIGGSGGDYIDCRDVVLFSRILRMIEASSNSLRQQLVNDESEFRSGWKLDG